MQSHALVLKSQFFLICFDLIECEPSFFGLVAALGFSIDGLEMPGQTIHIAQ